MRKLLIIPAVLFFCNIAIAGKNDLNNVTSNPTLPGVFPHFNSGAGSNNSTQKSYLRLVAKVNMAFKYGSFEAVDSIAYTYSENRGGVPNPEDMNNDEHIYYDVGTKYVYNAINKIYELKQQRRQKFKDKNVAELVYREWDKSGGAWDNTERYRYYYDNNNIMQASTHFLWYANQWTQPMNSTLSYDNSNNVIEMNSIDYNVDFYYDANNNLIAVEDAIWSQTNGWVKNERKSYSYSGTDVTEFVLEKWSGTNWVKEERTEYKYDLGNNVIESILYKWANGTWANNKKHDYKYDAKGNVLEDITYNWNSSSFKYTEYKKEIRNYNSLSLPEELIVYTWDGNSWAHQTNDTYIKYHYEQYSPTSVNQFANTDKLNVYPIPASNVVNVDIKMTYPEVYSLTMCDMTGRVVYNKKDARYQRSTEVIPVHNLASGTYLISINSSKEQFVEKVVVSH